MSEKIEIFKLDIDVSKVIKETEKTKKEIDQLAAAQKELKKSGDTSNETFIENEAQLKKLRKEYNSQIKVIQSMSGGVDNLEKELTKEIKTIRQAKDQNQALRRIRDEINVDTEEGQKILSQLNDRIDQNTELTKENTDAVSRQKSNVGNYTESINKAKVGVRAFGGALKAAGIGMAVAAFAALSSALGKNEKVMRVVNTAMNAFSAVVQPIISSIIEGAKAAYEATGGFDALGRVVSSLITLALTPLKIQFYAVKEAIIAAQLGYEKLFGSDAKVKELTRDLKENRKALQEVKLDAQKAGKQLYSSFSEAAGEIGSVYTNLSKSVGSTINELKNQDIIGNAYDVAKFQQQIKKIDAQREAIMLKYQQEAELLRQRRDDETLSMAQRKEANAQLISLQNEQISKEKELINQKVAGYKRMLQINKDDTEAQVALLEAKNELLDVEERVTGTMSEALVNRNTLRKEDLANIETANNAEVAAEENKLNRIEQLKKQFRNREKEQEALDSQVKIDKHYADLEKEIQLMIEENTVKKELLRNLRVQWDEETAEYQANKRAIQTQKKQTELENFVAVEKAKIENKRKTIDAIAGLFGKETAVAKGALIAKQVLALREFAIEQGLFQAKKAMAVGETVVATTTGMAKTASVGFPWNIPLIAGFIGQTAGLISTIKSVVAPQKPSIPKAARGITLSGKSHAQGGETLFDESGNPVVEAEGDENIYVLNKRASGMINSLSYLNESTGGIPLNQSTTYAAAGGMIQKSISLGSGGSGQAVDYDLMAEKIAEANRSLPSPQVAVTEINDGQGKYADIVNGASW